MPLPEGVRAVLTDIEGTTTPLTFVADVLFPFAKERLEDACLSEDPRFVEAVRQLRQEHEAERGSGVAIPDFGTGAPYARHLMELDRKSTGLKALQGLIWEDGYRTGELKGDVYPDVPEALKSWKEKGIRVRIFSSGSILAQKLLFGHTDYGDLLSYFEGYHDTTTGPKREAGAYTAIAEAFGLPPGEILFLSDVVEELNAAREAGMQTGLFLRPGNKPADPGSHPAYRSFAELT
ncbi:MAG TPA: acireductone synthase [Thermoanaerobaculia bacterium]|nr:acireductone synthase [Thermoanaerobaculia bacterium]